MSDRSLERGVEKDIEKKHASSLTWLAGPNSWRKGGNFLLQWSKTIVSALQCKCVAMSTIAAIMLNLITVIRWSHFIKAFNVWIQRNIWLCIFCISFWLVKNVKKISVFIVSTSGIWAAHDEHAVLVTRLFWVRSLGTAYYSFLRNREHSLVTGQASNWWMSIGLTSSIEK